MFFTKVGTVVVVIVMFFGAFAVLSGLLVANNPELAGRYFSSSVGSGERIDQGLVAIFIGIAFGVVTEISRSLAKLVNRKDAN
tara:strand:- start:426 stop:674 length:249 start_codon:yes stop_codon:yes gene_type:complete